MMLSSKVESEESSAGDSGNGTLLRDIEAISKALYLHNTPPKVPISPSDRRSKSAGKTRLTESKSKSKLRFYKDLLHNDKKSSIWNWKPLKALSHIRNHRLSCCFYLYVHSIEGLPVSFNDFSLCVHWKRKDEGLQTRASRVYQGVAEFEETLMHRCSVCISRSGPHHAAKYEPKLFLVYASLVGAAGLDIGKNWVDLTRLLPVTLDELEEEKSSGKWTTSFKLTGKAKGATLNVSFGYSVMQNDLVESGSNINVPELTNLQLNRSRTMQNAASFGCGQGYGMLQKVGSVPRSINHGSHISSQSTDAMVLCEVFPKPGSELFSRSINFLYQKLDEAKLGSSTEFDLPSENVQPLKPKPHSFNESSEEHVVNECDDIEFTVIEKGIEFSLREHFKLEESADQTFNGFSVEAIHVADSSQGDGVGLDEEMKFNSKDDVDSDYKDDVIVDDYNCKENNMCTRESSMEELECAFDSLLLPNLDSPTAMSEFFEKEDFMDVQSNCKASKMVRSLSLDDVTESVANDFLNMLGIEHSPNDFSDSDPESPRERLLKQFEMEALASGNFILNINAKEEDAEFGCDAPTTSGTDDIGEDFEFQLVIQAAEQEHKRVNQSLISRRKAKMLENLETEALMQEWGLNEMAFQSSPRYSPGGFGSPIDSPPEEPLELPPLGEGLGPFFQTKNGGFLRSMNPLFFRNAKNGSSLIMQISSPVVLPAEMGSGIMDILQHLASIGIEKLSTQTIKLMPLEDITGKTMHQVAWEAASSLEVPKRMAYLQLKSEDEKRSFGKRNKTEGLLLGLNYENWDSSLAGDLMGSDHVSLEDLAPLAMDRIEALLIDGLRIQSGLSDEKAPSSIYPQAIEGNGANFGGSLNLGGAAGLQVLNARDNDSDVDGLLGLSITLDEWLKLDAGIISDEDQISERTLKILAVHHAQCVDLMNERITGERKWGKASGRICGLLGNNLTVVLTVQLRDPLRNYEPVGAPMLALIQVERVYVPLKLKMNSLVSENSNKEYYGFFESEVQEEVTDKQKVEKKVEEEKGFPLFKITEVHVAGMNNIELGKKQLWGTTIQQQSGFRWLLASGMGKTDMHPFSKSKAIVKSSPLAITKVHLRDILWSISACIQGMGAKWKKLAAVRSHIRNPDVVFPNETVRLR